MPNSALQFDDAEIASATVEDDQLTLVFSNLYLQKSEGIVGADASTLWTVAAQLVLREIEDMPDLPSFPAKVVSGRIRVNQYTYVGLCPLPLEMPGYVSLQLQLEGVDEPFSVDAGYVRYFPTELEKYIKHLGQESFFDLV